MDDDTINGGTVTTSGIIFCVFPNRLHQLYPLSKGAAQFIIWVLLLCLLIVIPARTSEQHSSLGRTSVRSPPIPGRPPGSLP